LIWKFCKPFDVVPVAVIGKDEKEQKQYTKDYD